MPLCKYICIACNWQTVTVRPVSVMCKQCGGIYLRWTNWLAVVKFLLRTDIDYAVSYGNKIKLYAG
jgi:hypothetical protein